MADKPIIDERTMRVLLNTFADACARFSAQLLAGKGISGESPLETPLRIDGDETQLEAGPAWIKREYERSREAAGLGEDVKSVDRRLARNRVVLAMHELGLTQRQLADRVGMAPNSVSRILQNPERSRVATIRKIAQAINVDLADIL